MNLKEYSTHAFYILFGASIILSFFIIKPLLIPILTSVAIVYILTPLHRLIRSKIKNTSLCAAISSTIVIFFFTIPLLLTINILSNETYVLYILAKQGVAGGFLENIQCPEISQGILCQLREFTTSQQFITVAKSTLEKVNATSVELISSYIISVPTMLMNIFLTLFLTFFLFRDGEVMLERLRDLISLNEHHQKHLYNKLGGMVHAVIYGNIITAIIQGVVAAVGYIITGVTSPITWGILTALLSFTPFLGTALVWLPLAIIKYLQGEIVSAGGILLVGIVISLIDNIIKPKIIGDRTQIHPVIIILGIIGGVALFGFIGIIYGPLILAVFSAFLNIYEAER